MNTRGVRFMDWLKKTRLATRAEMVPSHKLEKNLSTAYIFLSTIKRITVKARRQAEEDMRRM